MPTAAVLYLEFSGEDLIEMLKQAGLPEKNWVFIEPERQYKIIPLP